MSKPEKTNGSQALGRVLFLAQPANDDCAGNGSVTNGNEDELSSLPEEFRGMYRACYEAGYVSGWEAGFRQGYEAGFEGGRRQGDAGSTAAAAARREQCWEQRGWERRGWERRQRDAQAAALRPALHEVRRVVFQRRGALSAVPDSEGKSGGGAANELNMDQHARDEKLTRR